MAVHYHYHHLLQFTLQGKTGLLLLLLLSLLLLLLFIGVRWCYII